MVSIVITLYNKETYIERAIKSALNQTYDNCEIIVVDDCSTDNSKAICFKYNNVIKLFSNETNQGLPKSRQIGIKLAKGDFLTFLDADDYLSNDALSKCIELQKTTQADIIQMNIKRRITRFNIPVNFKSIYDSSHALNACLYNEQFFPVHCCGKLYKTELLRSIKPIQYNGFWGEDRIFNLPIFASQPKIEYVPSVKYNYRWSGSGATSTSFNLDALQEYKQVYQIKSDWAKKYGYEHYIPAMQNELVELLKYHIRHLINSNTMSYDSAIDFLQNEMNRPFWRCFQLPPAETLYKIEKKSISRIAKKVINNLIS